MSHRPPIVTGLPGILFAFAAAAAWGEATTPGQPAADELHAQPLRPGLFVVSGDGGNVAVWSGPDGVVLVDAGLAQEAPRLLETVARIAPGPIRFVVNTHWHPDHSGGNEAAGKEGAVLIAHDASRSAMATSHVSDEYEVRIPASARAALPTLTLTDTASLHVNGDVLRIVHIAAAHTDGDLVVWWQQANAVHLGDVFYNGGYPFLDLANGGSLAGMVAVLEGTLSRADADTVVIPGHGPVAGRAELAEYRDMLVGAGRRVRELVEQGRSLEEVLAARPTEAYDARYGQGSVPAERFVRLLYQDLTAGR